MRRFTSVQYIAVLACVLGGAGAPPKTANQDTSPEDKSTADQPAARPPAARTPLDEQIKIFHLQNADAASMQENLQMLFQNRNVSVAVDRRTNTLTVRATEDILAEVEAFVMALDSLPPQKPRQDRGRFIDDPGSREHGRFIPDPDASASKSLLEQLHAQESAAAVEAETIRKLQANGAAEQSKQKIAEHQRKLKSLLSTAFDLKLQLEELQMQELHSRLSQLERQIGQRKELREKIIARRTTELIEGDVLKWDKSGAGTSGQGESNRAAKGPAPKRPALADESPAIKKLRERVVLISMELRAGKVKIAEALQAYKDLAEVEPAEAVEHLQTLLEISESLFKAGASTRVDLLSVQAAFELAKERAKQTGATEATPRDTSKPPLAALPERTMLDFICREAYAHVAALTTLEYTFETKDTEGWHSKAEFHADKERFLIKRVDVTGLLVLDKRLNPMTCAAAFDGVRQQYLDANGRLRLKTGVEGAAYTNMTPQQAMYIWLRGGSGDLRWDSVLNQELWERRFAEATYVGAIPEDGRTLEIVDFPQKVKGLKPCVFRVFFARDLGFAPVKCIRRNAATTETSTAMHVNEFKTIVKDGKEYLLPLSLNVTETGADGVSRIQEVTMTVSGPSIKVNEPLDESLFTIPQALAKEVYDVDRENALLEAGQQNGAKIPAGRK